MNANDRAKTVKSDLYGARKRLDSAVAATAKAEAKGQNQTALKVELSNAARLWSASGDVAMNQLAQSVCSSSLSVLCGSAAVAGAYCRQSQDSAVAVESVKNRLISMVPNLNSVLIPSGCAVKNEDVERSPNGVLLTLAGARPPPETVVEVMIENANDLLADPAQLAPGNIEEFTSAQVRRESVTETTAAPSRPRAASANAILGKPLWSLPCEDGVPKVITVLCEKIEAEVTSVEGIFRISGSKEAYQQVLEACQENASIQDLDVVACSAVIKGILRQAAGGLVAVSQWGQLMTTANMIAQCGEEKPVALPVPP